MRIDSVDAGRVLAPRSIEEVAEVLREERGTLSPVGSGTDLRFGNPLESADCVLRMRELRRVTEYNPADLTVHVEAGITLEELEDVLAEHGQMLPLDPWSGPGVTMGGLVATNAHGPMRTIGSVRDWIIGMRVVHADGRTTRTGGRVVKNVSGYDLAKLYTGSVGTLAVIVEISFKVSAKWASTATARARPADESEAERLVRALRTGPLAPIALVWAGPGNEVVVRFGGERTALDWQLARLPDADWERFDAETEAPVWKSVREAYGRMPEPVVRVAALPCQVEEMVRRLRPAAWLAQPAPGIALMSLPEDRIRELRKAFPAVVLRASLETRRSLPTFGLRGIEYDLMSRIKTEFDPARRLNRGRHVDGERSDGERAE